MIKCGSWPVGVCTWSLQQSVEGVSQALEKLNVEHVHLALPPALADDGESYLQRVRANDWTITATMMGFAEEDYTSMQTIKATGGIVPDHTWPRNFELLVKGFDITSELNVPYLSLHLGFIGEPGSAQWAKMADRTKRLADEADGRGVGLILETGQETALELRTFLQELDHPALGINFDPANMILYQKGEPISALKMLAPWLKHIHAKDASGTPEIGAWGMEVPWGNGDVETDVFYSGALAIEREMGDSRFEDIELAVKRMSAYPG